MIRIRQRFDASSAGDAADAVRREFSRPEITQLVSKGDRVAVCVGSRGIFQIDKITLAAITQLKALGAEPFIVPAMGSHGGATPSGQKEVLASYGITEGRMGVPVDPSMDTVFLGRTDLSLIHI